MADEVAIKIKLDAAEGARSVKELKQSIRDLTGEAVAAGQRGDAAMRTAYINAAGKAKEQLRELNKEIKLSGDAVGKLQAVQGVGMGIAHGFEAAKGAAALFGASSKDVEEQLLKIQAVMAFTQGITGIFEGVKAINMMSASFGIAATVSEAFGVSAAAAEAMATAGITALIGALVAIITNFDKVSEFVKEHSALIRDYLLSVITLGIYPIVKGLMMLTGQMDQVSHAAEVNAAKMALQAEDHRKKVDELSGAYDNLHDKVETTREANVHTLSVLDDQIRLMKAQGASADEIYQAEKKVLDIKIAQAKMERDELLAQAELNKLVSAKWQLEDMYSKATGGKGIGFTAEDEEKLKAQDDLINKLETDQQILGLDYIKTIDKAAAATIDKADQAETEWEKAYDKQMNDVAKQWEDQLNKRDEAQKQFDDAQRSQEEQDLNKKLDAIGKEGQAWIDAGLDQVQVEKWVNDQKLKVLKDYHDKVKEEQDKLSAEARASHQKDLDDEWKDDMDAWGKRADLAKSYTQSLISLNETVTNIELAKAKGNAAEMEKIRRHSFERNKALQITLAIIDGFKAVTSTLAQYPKTDMGISMWATIGAEIAVTAASIAKIAATQYQSSGSGSGSFSPPAISTNPSTDIYGGLQQQSTVLSNLQSQSNAKQPTVKAIVVETDITKTQNRVNTIQERAQIS
jgi:hypothetical protein